MNKIFLILTLFSTLTLSADNLAFENAAFPIIETSSLTVSLTDIKQREFFESAQFDFVHNNLEFEAVNKIKYIQIFTAEGKLKFQIPVRSKSVFISKKLFKTGTYKLGFMIEGHTEVEFTTVKILR